MVEGTPHKRRLFAGVELDESVRAACASISEELRRTGFEARYETPEKLHLTLAFLGFVEPFSLNDIIASLASTAARTGRLGVTFDTLGAFPHERRPRVVYAGAREQGSAFRELAAKIRRAYEALDFEFDKDAAAHVTLARVKESRQPLPLVEFAPIRLEIRELALFESLHDPARNTSRYEIVARAPVS
ncbi:MAG TPA: RNA 2',3'-cyclic phosphodiesterase [Candidatus Cybelea sp.]|nr:RNA 2',3'-cyclic phosphodiesterase [Candidatus Cybelea sp.]